MTLTAHRIIVTACGGVPETDYTTIIGFRYAAATIPSTPRRHLSLSYICGTRKGGEALGAFIAARV